MAVKRIYYDRQPKVGDNIITRKDSIIGGWKADYEYIVAKLGNGYVVAYNERLGYSDMKNGGIEITDGEYRIFEDVNYEPDPTKVEKLKETHEYTYRILGVPMYKRTLKIYEETK